MLYSNKGVNLVKYVSQLGVILTAILGVLFGVYRHGRKVQQDESVAADFDEYVETKERIDNVEASPDRDAAIERLQSNRWTR